MKPEELVELITPLKVGEALESWPLMKAEKNEPMVWTLISVTIDKSQDKAVYRFDLSWFGVLFQRAEVVIEEGKLVDMGVPK